MREKPWRKSTECGFACHAGGHTGSRGRPNPLEPLLPSQHFPQRLLNLARFREPPVGFFGVDEVTVHGDFEDAVFAFDELRLDAELAFDVGRQTGGAGAVVSNDAVFDLYVGHSALLRARL